MGSYDYGKAEICAWIRREFPPTEDYAILDVGAGDGKWRRLLPEYRMDAVEIFRPYAERLTGYRHVMREDIADLKYGFSAYDLIIFGDVIEHMPVEQAQAVLEYAKPRCWDMIVAVPFLYRQAAVDGNDHQAHIQDDLTPEIFAERYPGFEVLLDTGKSYCYYHLKEREET
ncbi:MAG: class I SAM-dependent methyltransferase [Oscillospiraceae bacterium]|nr:class I SAM-dependent methyltransferase [Oscillospiraceae bacterium]